VDDIKYFDQFRNLKAFVQSVHYDEDFKSVSINNKWVQYLQKNGNTDCHSELFKIAELFFCIPGPSTSVERIFSLMNIQWTDE
jgi:hypothetical protein